MSGKLYIVSLVVSLSSLLWMAMPVAAVAAPQDQTERVYVVEAGDTLFSIARAFGVTVDHLMAANRLENPDVLSIGQTLIVPGTVAVAPETPATAPVPTQSLGTYLVQPGDTLGAIAGRFGVTVDAIVQANGLVNADVISVGQLLVLPGSQVPQTLPFPFTAVTVSPPFPTQGQTVLLKVTMSRQAAVTAEFDGRAVHFHGQDRDAWALIGIHPLQPVRVYPVTLVAEYGGNHRSEVTIDVPVSEGSFVVEDIQPAPGTESLLDPDLVAKEYQTVSQAWGVLTPFPSWEGTFRLPLATNRITSFYGTRRSYAGGNVDSFHSGIDFGAEEGAVVMAPAGGRVVLAEPLTVRGNSVIIDHGVGVFSGYWHLSKVAVLDGQSIQAGDLIGFVGSTGLSTGSHLHWEMRLDGIPVDPMEWTERTFP